MRIRLLVLLAFAAGPALAAIECSHGRMPITSIAYRNTTVAGCDLPCSSFCGWKPNAQPENTASLLVEPPEQPDPRRDPMRGLDPAILEDFYDDSGYYCGPVPYMKPWNHYALEATDAQILAIADVAPAAAWAVAVSQVQGLARPAPLEVGQGSYTRVINAAMVKLLLAGQQDAPEFLRAAPELTGDVGFLTTSRVDRLRSGRRLIVVETELLHGPTLSTVGIPYPPFGIEIERVAGRTLPNPDEPGNPARVWRVVSWGEPAAYYGPRAGGDPAR